MNFPPPANDTPQKIISGFGSTMAVTLTRADSGGVIGMFEALVPVGNGTPIHVHHKEDETHHILQGTYEFWLDGRSLVCPAGTSIFLPRGVPHAFRVIGSVTGRNLAIVTPGGCENFFVEISDRALSFPEHMPELVELAMRYGLEFKGPPPWAAKAPGAAASGTDGGAA